MKTSKDSEAEDRQWSEYRSILNASCDRIPEFLPGLSSLVDQSRMELERLRTANAVLIGVWAADTSLSYQVPAADHEIAVLVNVGRGNLYFLDEKNEVTRLLAHDWYVLRPGSRLIIESETKISMLLVEFASKLWTRQDLHFLCGKRGMGDRPADQLFLHSVVNLLKAARAEGLARTPDAEQLMMSSLRMCSNMQMAYQPQEVSDPLVERADRVIQEGLPNVDLSVDFIARTLGVSKSRLNKAYRGSGRTVERAKWDGRLRAAALDLRSPGCRHLPIQLIASGNGFKTPSHFQREFKKAYGLTPRHFRLSEHVHFMPQGDIAPDCGRSAPDAAVLDPPQLINGADQRQGATVLQI